MTHPPIPHLATAPGARRLDRLSGWMLAICCLAVAVPIRAQSLSDDASRRERIEIERRQADAVLEQRRWQCSRRFAVTACMNEASAAHRDSVELLGREEAAIDSRARQARAAKRLEIIREKTEAFARLSPVPSSQVPTPSQPAVQPLPVTTGSEAPPTTTARQNDQAAADRAAARRAAASQLRREEAAREQAQRAAKRAEQKAPMPGLPARPPIPPAKPASSAN